MVNLTVPMPLFFLDVADPVTVMSWGMLVAILLTVFVLAVIFTAGLVVLLIRFKRRKIDSTQ